MPFQRLLPVQPLQLHYPDDAADTREPNAALSGTSLASTPPSVYIQRQTPVFPRRSAATVRSPVGGKCAICAHYESQMTQSLLQIKTTPVGVVSSLSLRLTLVYPSRPQPVSRLSRGLKAHQ